jgi:uncharacterized protein (DUF927 family)
MHRSLNPLSFLINLESKHFILKTEFFHILNKQKHQNGAFHYGSENVMLFDKVIATISYY